MEAEKHARLYDWETEQVDVRMILWVHVKAPAYVRARQDQETTGECRRIL